MKLFRTESFIQRSCLEVCPHYTSLHPIASYRVLSRLAASPSHLQYISLFFKASRCTSLHSIAPHCTPSILDTSHCLLKHLSTSQCILTTYHTSKRYIGGNAPVSMSSLRERRIASERATYHFPESCEAAGCHG